MIRGIILAAFIAAMPAVTWAGDSDGISRVVNDARSLNRLVERIYGARPTPVPTIISPIYPLDIIRSAPALPFSDAIGEASATYRIPQPLIAAVIKCESDWNPSALSPKGARGLMQIMPGTAINTFGIGPVWLWTPKTNIMVGTAYLRLLANRYQGNSSDVVAAYNAGPGRVDRRTGLPLETRKYRRCVGLWHGRYAKVLR